MEWMKQVRRSMIAGTLTVVWVAQPAWILGEVPSGNRTVASRDNAVGVGTGGGADPISARKLVERNAHQHTMTPLGVPSPPHQLTPAPVLPFHPNRHLMPSPTAPPNAQLGGGYLGR